MQFFVTIREDGTTAYSLNDNTELYFEALIDLKSEIINVAPKLMHHLSAIALCSATLEYSLNFIIVNHFSNKLPDDYLDTAEKQINKPLSKKLKFIPLLVSENKLCWKEKNSNVQTLFQLLDLRNKILHNKEFLHSTVLPKSSIVIPWVDFTIDVNKINQDPLSLAAPNVLFELSSELSLSFLDAMIFFKDNFLMPLLDGNLEANELLKNTKAKK